MPYIKKEERPKIDNLTNELDMVIEGPGELNYAITSLVQLYF